MSAIQIHTIRFVSHQPELSAIDYRWRYVAGVAGSDLSKLHLSLHQGARIDDRYRVSWSTPSCCPNRSPIRCQLQLQHPSKVDSAPSESSSSFPSVRSPAYPNHHPTPSVGSAVHRDSIGVTSFNFASESTELRLTEVDSNCGVAWQSDVACCGCVQWRGVA